MAAPSDTATKPSSTQLRDPPGSLPRDVMSTTRFFRNRFQHQAALRSCGGNRVLVAGCSRGCEAYSLGIEAQLAGRALTIDAIDYDPLNINDAIRNRFSDGDFIDFDEISLMTSDVKPFFENYSDGIRVRVDLLNSLITFRVADLMDIEGSYDLIICNNVLIHFQQEKSLNALQHLCSRLTERGVLAIGGINLDILSGFSQAHQLAPIHDSLSEIWDSWKGDRLSWSQDPDSYVAMGPLDTSLPDWNFRFCTLFRRLPSPFVRTQQ